MITNYIDVNYLTPEGFETFRGYGNPGSAYARFLYEFPSRFFHIFSKKTLKVSGFYFQIGRFYSGYQQRLRVSLGAVFGLIHCPKTPRLKRVKWLNISATPAIKFTHC
jgi:hypothetical protein